MTEVAVRGGAHAPNADFGRVSAGLRPAVGCRLPHGLGAWPGGAAAAGLSLQEANERRLLARQTDSDRQLALRFRSPQVRRQDQGAVRADPAGRRAPGLRRPRRAAPAAPEPGAGAEAEAE